MSFTLSTVPLSLLALFLCHRAKWRLLPVAMFMSVFQAASILNLNSNIGVGISYVLLLAAIAKSYLRRTIPQQYSPGRKLTRALVILFTAYSAFSAIVFPFIFQGTLYTNPGMGFKVPLRWESGHLHQLFYLLLCVALFFVASRRTSLLELQQSLNWYIGGNTLASVIAIYQFLCLKTGLPFPSDLLYTSPTYGTFRAYEIGNFARINSTFVEASAAAGLLTPALAILFWRLLNKPCRKDALCGVFILIGLFLTISTTGYLCFGFLFLMSAAIFLFKWSPNPRSRAARLVFAGTLTLLVSGFLLAPSGRAVVADLLDTVIFSKMSSFSYEQRSEMNADAWRTAADTLWLGAGWGVCRASSLVPTLFANIGIPGMFLFACLLGRVFRSVWRTSRTALIFHGQPVFAAATALVGLIVAGPEFTGVPMWFFLAAAIAGVPANRHLGSSASVSVPVPGSVIFAA